MRQTTRLGRYHLIERIAYGGMAEIFRAVTYDEEGYRRDVAVKKLLPHFVEDVQFIDMLTDEFKVVSHLRHANIAEVYELVQVGDSLLIAMEYLDGKDLRSTVERARRMQQPLGFDHIAYIMARSLDGLHHAHIARDENDEPLKIVHRDFSPSNILMAYDGRIKICDFGIAKATHNRVQTKTGVIKGKVKYMSPEQAFGKRLDQRSDIFSAGSVLYELCTDQAPFHTESEIDLIFLVRDANPIPCRQVNPEIPEELARIIERAMRRSRSERYQNAELFRSDLVRFLRDYNAQYSRSKLSGLMRSLWKAEIDAELRTMEDLVLDSSTGHELGTNLIADAMGARAVYARFTPMPARLADLERGDPQGTRTELSEPPLHWDEADGEEFVVLESDLMADPMGDAKTEVSEPVTTPRDAGIRRKGGPKR